MTKNIAMMLIVIALLGFNCRLSVGIEFGNNNYVIKQKSSSSASILRQRMLPRRISPTDATDTDTNDKNSVIAARNELLRIRGGSNYDNSYGQQHQQQQPYQRRQQVSPPPPLQQQRQGNNIDPDFQQQMQEVEEIGMETPTTTSMMNEEELPFLPRETVQDRVDKWKHYQLEHAKNSQVSTSQRDEFGNLKLFSNVGKGSRAVTFFILMWRDVALYESADLFFKRTKYNSKSSFSRFYCLTFLTCLFLSNLIGFIITMTSAPASTSATSPHSSYHTTKKNLKKILNMDKFVEIAITCYHLYQLTGSAATGRKSDYAIPREVHISSILYSLYFLLQTQAVTKLSWNDIVPSGILQDETIDNSYYGEANEQQGEEILPSPSQYEQQQSFMQQQQQQQGQPQGYY